MVEWPCGETGGAFMRFTIRDLLWLMVVVGMAIGWRLHYVRLSVTYGDWNEQITEAVKDTLRATGCDCSGKQKLN